MRLLSLAEGNRDAGERMDATPLAWWMHLTIFASVTLNHHVHTVSLSGHSSGFFKWTQVDT